MTGIVIPLYNRPQELAQCLESVRAADYPEDTLFILINDASGNPEAIELYNRFEMSGYPVIKYSNSSNQGICRNLIKGIDRALSMGCDVVINLDSDAIVKPDWVLKLLELHKQIPDNILTGFHSINKNRNGTERHPIIKSFKNYHLKKSVGGINMLATRPLYNKYMLPALKKGAESGGNWDHMTSIACMEDDNPIACLFPSVVQHIAQKSSMGHAEEPDIACDFCNLSLPNITLIGVDCRDINRLLRAAEISTRDIMFGSVKMLSSNISKHPYAIKCKPILSKEAYSRFIMKDLVNYVDTDFALIIQHDGYVLNYKSWDPKFLEYDYIGATWNYKDGMNNGNGGFSLRSKRLLNILKTDPEIRETHPEDHHISRTYRRHLEQAHLIKFAPEEIANRFSIEAFGCTFQGANKYSGQFGFHGYNVDFTGSGLKNIPLLPKPIKR